MGNRTAIYDYKSGAIPSQDQIHSGFAPQLVLESAMAMQGAFGREVPTTVQDAAYLGVSGSAKEKKHISVGNDDRSLAELAPEHFERFRKLLERYLDPDVAYLPRHNLQKETGYSNYDHLSRYYEWRQAEGSDS
jgi:ATP-dependent helicase/nuclease subunit B